MSKKKNKLKKLHLRQILIFFIIILLGIGGATLAKYIIEEFHGYYLNSKHFYFTSNRLKEDNPLYQINNWSGVGSFNISFDLLSQKNSLVYTDYDIPYEVTYTCPADVICSVDKPTGTVYSASTTHSDTITISVNPQRAYVENERLVVHVAANSTSPYVKTITADFEYVVGKQGITYQIDDVANQAYMYLKITSAINYCTVIEAFDSYSVGATIPNNDYRNLSDVNKAKCISKNIRLDFDPNVLLLDTTGSILDVSTYSNTTIGGVDYINQLNFSVAPLSTMAIKFYKKNTASNYTYPIVNANSIVTVTVNDPI